MSLSKSTKRVSTILKKAYQDNVNLLEIGVDEAGRGPMLGRVYSAAVVLPQNDTFRYDWMKDSKKFTSKNKICEVADYIKDNALYWAVSYETEEMIDKVNIRNATLMSMHGAIRSVFNQKKDNDYLLLIDGNDFNPYIEFSESGGYKPVPHVCIKSGDNKYAAIAAASILAKVSRDEYIQGLCEKDNSLIDRYDLLNNKGYGTKKHMLGIHTHGISQYHRKTFGLCRKYS